MGSRCIFFFLFGIQVPPSKMEGGGEEEEEGGGEQSGHLVCVLRLDDDDDDDGKHFCRDSATLDTDVNYFKIFLFISSVSVC